MLVTPGPPHLALHVQTPVPEHSHQDSLTLWFPRRQRKWAVPLVTGDRREARSSSRSSLWDPSSVPQLWEGLSQLSHCLSLTAAFSRCPLSEPPGSLLEPDSGGCPCRASHMDDANLSPSLHFQRQEQGYSGPLRSDQVCLGARQWCTGNLGLQGLCSAHGVSQSHVRGVQCTQGQAWLVLSWANSRGCCWLLGGGQLL